MAIGEQIKAARKKVGITQAELANRLGISYVGVSQWENGLRKPKYETKKRIANALGLPYYEVFTDVDDDLVRAAIEESALEHADFIIELDSLSNEEAALKVLLNSLGYDIMKTGDGYFFMYESGGSQISQDDLKELLNCAQHGLKVAAKALELKLLQEAFGSKYRAEPAPPPPPQSSEGTDTTPPSDAPETPPERE